MSTWPRGKRWQGGVDMGRPRVPPLPQNIIMTARDTGQRYFLTHSGTSPTLTAVMSTTLPTKPDTVTYHEYGGPYLNGNVRLYVTGGTLQSEVMAINEPLIWSARVLTRRGYERIMVEITANAAGTLIYMEVEA